MIANSNVCSGISSATTEPADRRLGNTFQRQETLYAR